MVLVSVKADLVSRDRNNLASRESLFLDERDNGIGVLLGDGALERNVSDVH